MSEAKQLIEDSEVKRILREYDRIQQQQRMLEEEEQGLVEELKDLYGIDIDRVRP